MAKHLAHLDRALTGVATGNIKRLIVEMPPRHGKSELCSKYFPAWYLGTFPDRDIILTSATDELATDFSVAARDVLDEHSGKFGVSLRGDMRAGHRWALEQGGSLRAAGVGGGIMGRGASVLLVDDYCKNVESALSETQRDATHKWFMSTSSTRLTPDGAIVIVATRWHPKDLIGRLLEESERGGEQWTRIRFPAIAKERDELGREPGDALWESRYSRKWMEQRRDSYIASGYEWMWAALYDQDPPEVLDVEWPRTYFTDAIWFDQWPHEDRIVWRVMMLDPSKGREKGDYSAYIMAVLDEEGTVWIDADIERRDARRIVDDGLSLDRLFRPDVFGVEINQFQELLESMFADRARALGVMMPRFYGVNNLANKIERIRTLTASLAHGRFKFKRGSPGTALLVEQLKGFPSTKHDDGPDALEGAERLLRHLSANGLGMPGWEEPELERFLA